jgi:ABC-type transport system substrate-binding protein
MQLMRKHLYASAIFGLILACLTAFSLAQEGEKILVYGQSVPVTDLGPAYGAFLNYPAGYEVAFVLYDRLVTFDEELNIEPQLATSWETSDDGRTWTFKLRDGVKFHDGTDFNAEAVKFNVERMMDSERNTTNRPLWNPISGASVIDDYTVQITTAEPYSMLLNTLAHGSGAVVSPTAVEMYGDEGITTNPVGTGPYQLNSFNPGQEVVLSAFEGYWAGRPYLDQLVFRYIPEASTRIAALRSGSVHVVDGVSPQLASSLRNDPNVSVLTKPGLRPMGFVMMTQRPPLDDVRVRQALNHAVPREAIARTLFQGFAQSSDSPLAFNTFGHRGIGGYEHDPEKASALLAEAGWTDTDGDGVLDRDGEALELTIYTPEGLFPGDIDVTEVTANALGEVGIATNIVKIEKGGYWSHLRYAPAEIEWDIAMFGFNPSNAGGTYHLDALFTSNPDESGTPAAWNIARYHNEEVDALIGEAKVTIDPQSRANLLGQVQEIVWEDSPYIWLQVNEIISAARSDIEGVEVWPVIFTVIRNANF